MFKNIQIKIVVIFTIIGIAIISGLGLFFINELNSVNTAISSEGITLEQVASDINNISNQTKIVFGICVGVYVLISVLLGIFLSKVVIYPINRLIKSAEKIASGEEVSIAGTENKDGNEVNGLVNAFDMMTSELLKLYI